MTTCTVFFRLMALYSLDRLLLNFQGDPRWARLRRYQEVSRAWHQAIAPEIRSHTRLLQLRQQILWVATPSSVWAQTLTLQRQQFLLALNKQLSEAIADLRFSPLQWQQQSPSPQLQQEEQQRQFCFIDPEREAASPPPQRNLEQIFQDWQKILQRRAQQLPTCPQCHTPTLPWELSRWSVCGLCARQRWSQNLSQNRDS